MGLKRCEQNLKCFQLIHFWPFPWDVKNVLKMPCFHSLYFNVVECFKTHSTWTLRNVYKDVFIFIRNNSRIKCRKYHIRPLRDMNQNIFCSFTSPQKCNFSCVLFHLHMFLLFSVASGAWCEPVVCEELCGDRWGTTTFGSNTLLLQTLQRYWTLHASCQHCFWVES